ncbi:hypothetical protein QF002_000078 [Paraburkholderia youngii]
MHCKKYLPAIHISRPGNRFFRSYRYCSRELGLTWTGKPLLAPAVIRESPIASVKLSHAFDLYHDGAMSPSGAR